MRIFLDANIFISGIVFKGKEHDLLIKNKHILFVTSEDVIDETMKTIKQKFPESYGLAETFIEMLNPIVVKRKEYIKKLDEYNVVRDKNDRHIIAASVTSKSGFIVSGDIDLLTLKKYKNIKIVKASEMLSLLK